MGWGLTEAGNRLVWKMRLGIALQDLLAPPAKGFARRDHASPLPVGRIGPTFVAGGTK